MFIWPVAEFVREPSDGIRYLDAKHMFLGSRFVEVNTNCDVLCQSLLVGVGTCWCLLNFVFIST